MIRTRSCPAGFCLAAALLSATPPLAARMAGDHAIRWQTIHAGGASLTRSSDYSLSGTIGQPAPGFSEGGDYTLHGGFWVAAPRLSGRIFENGFEGH